VPARQRRHRSRVCGVSGPSLPGGARQAGQGSGRRTPAPGPHRCPSVGIGKTEGVGVLVVDASDHDQGDLIEGPCVPRFRRAGHVQRPRHRPRSWVVTPGTTRPSSGRYSGPVAARTPRLPTLAPSAAAGAWARRRSPTVSRDACRRRPGTDPGRPTEASAAELRAYDHESVRRKGRCVRECVRRRGARGWTPIEPEIHLLTAAATRRSSITHGVCGNDARFWPHP
jgi:hypothetical protein